MFQHVRGAAGSAPIQVSQAARMAMMFSFCAYVFLRALHVYFTCARAHAKKHLPNPAHRNACASRTRTHKSNSRALSKPRGQIISSRAHGHTGTFLTGTHGHTGHGHTGTRAHGHIRHGHTGTRAHGPRAHGPRAHGHTDPSSRRILVMIYAFSGPEASSIGKL